MYKKFNLISQNILKLMNLMNQFKIDNSFIIINQFNEYSDIIQYRAKYNEFKICTVKTVNLDPKLSFTTIVEV